MFNRGVGMQAKDAYRGSRAGSPRRDQRRFSKTAGRTRKENISKPVMRGGYRL